jgi:TolB-like protein/Flp pilus assembly protein TadD
MNLQTLGHYRIVEKVGEGGMGVVFRAHDERLDRDVALKVLPPGTLADDTARKRLRREAVALARLNHPHIEAIHNFETEGDVDFLVMEYVPGPTLADRLISGPLGEPEVLRVGLQLAMALEEAHAVGVVHRDLKPGNIKLTPKGQVKVLDFGLAALLRPSVDGEATRSAGETGSTAGTVPYMAPEQLRGDAADARSDIFAAGVVLYEMATGRRPFQGRVITELTDAILHSAPIAPTRIRPDVSARLGDVILKCLEKDPENRYQSAKELGVDVRRLAAPSTPPEAGPLPVARRRWTGARWLAVAATVVFAVAVLIWTTLNAGGWRNRLGGGTVIGSVAVLPFANLSGDEQNAYFSDGIAEEILAHLSRIPALKVVSIKRSKGPTLDPRQVGREVGVGAVLEGGVRREGNRVRVTARLTNAETGQLIWASEPLDRELSDIFAVQSGLALQIAAALNAVLTPQVKQSVERRPTENVEAYDAYLRGSDYYQRSDAERDIRAAAASFERATSLDPNFAAAHAMLSMSHSRLFWYYYDRSAQRVALARASIDRALALRPDLPEVHVALGYFYYWCLLDYAGAVQELTIAQKGRPSDSRALFGLGSVQRRQGRMVEAAASMEQAADLDPRNALHQLNLGETLALLRRTPEAMVRLDRATSLSPDWIRAWGLKARYLLRLAGDVDGARASLAAAATFGLSDQDLSYASVLADLFARDYRAGLARLSAESRDAFDNQFWFVPRPLLEAQLAGLAGDRQAERKHYEAAANVLERKVMEVSTDARVHGSLGIAYAGLGRKADAIREGQLALTLMPTSKEAYRGAFHVEEMARIYAILGERELAIEQLEHLMSIPFDLAAPGLRADPAWDSLREHPRFQRLVSR